MHTQPWRRQCPRQPLNPLLCGLCAAASHNPRCFNLLLLLHLCGTFNSLLCRLCAAPPPAWDLQPVTPSTLSRAQHSPPRHKPLVPSTPSFTVRVMTLQLLAVCSIHTLNRDSAGYVRYPLLHSPEPYFSTDCTPPARHSQLPPRTAHGTPLHNRLVTVGSGLVDVDVVHVYVSSGSARGNGYAVSLHGYVDIYICDDSIYIQYIRIYRVNHSLTSSNGNIHFPQAHPRPR